MTWQDAEEIERADVATFGPELGPVYHALHNECAWAHMKWHEYVEMYGTSDARIDLLNSAAAQFFRMIQDVLWEDALLHIARLTDVAERGKHRNLSIQTLPGKISDAALRQRVEERVVAAVSAADFARDWRNRHIAHRDFDLAVAEPLRPLEDASRLKVTEALTRIGAVLDEINRHYRNTTTAWQAGHLLTGATQMMYVLRDGLERERKRHKDLEAGRYDPNDWTNDPL